MKSTKHTKGIWEINPKAMLHVRCGSQTIANCSSGQSSDREEEESANAKLISAAPELLELVFQFQVTVKGTNSPIEKQIELVLQKAI